MEDNFSYKFFNTTASAWQAMHKSILESKQSVYWEIYTLVDDEIGRRYIDILCEKAKAGIDVKIIIDAFGSWFHSRASILRLKAAGADVRVFNSFHLQFKMWDWFRKVWHRTHRKVLIVDAQIAFVGGVNVARAYADWYDLHLMITGKIVKVILREFAKTYARAGGVKEKVWRFLRPKLHYRDIKMKEKINAIFHAPFYTTKHSPFKKFYTQSLASARKSFTMLTPYYVPSREFLKMATQAKSRGVSVSIILPWKTDEPIMRHLAMSFYGLSRKAGISLYFLKKMNHGKALCVDETIGFVGSVNFTPRSFFINQEAGIMFSDKNMVDELSNILEDWKKEAVPMTDFTFGQRSWLGRFKDWWVQKIEDYV